MSTIFNRISLENLNHDELIDMWLHVFQRAHNFPATGHMIEMTATFPADELVCIIRNLKMLIQQHRETEREMIYSHFHSKSSNVTLIRGAI